jgi:hypothetical protein
MKRAGPEIRLVLNEISAKSFLKTVSDFARLELKEILMRWTEVDPRAQGSNVFYVVSSLMNVDILTEGCRQFESVGDRRI